MTTKHLFAEMTWPEVNEAVLQRRVVLLPVGAIEQHGPASARRRRQPDHRLPVRGGGAAGTRHPAGDAADPLRLQRPQHGLPGHHLDPDGALPPLRRRRGHEPRPSGLPPHLPGQRARIQRSSVRPRRPADHPRQRGLLRLDQSLGTGLGHHRCPARGRPLRRRPCLRVGDLGVSAPRPRTRADGEGRGRDPGRARRSRAGSIRACRGPSASTS